MFDKLRLDYSWSSRRKCFFVTSGISADIVIENMGHIGLACVVLDFIKENRYTYRGGHSCQQVSVSLVIGVWFQRSFFHGAVFTGKQERIHKNCLPLKIKLEN